MCGMPDCSRTLLSPLYGSNVMRRERPGVDGVILLRNIIVRGIDQGNLLRSDFTRAVEE